jgi:hypothetical protein
LHGPQAIDLQPLPLGYAERESAKIVSEAGRMLAWYSRSLEHNNYDIQHHPSFCDYACGILTDTTEAMTQQLGTRFSPKMLPGLNLQSGDWEPVKVITSSKTVQSRKRP